MNILDIIRHDNVIHCDTENKALYLCQKLHQLGYKWRNKESYIKFNGYDNYGDKTCYDPHKGEYGTFETYKRMNYNIISFHDINFSMYDINSDIEELNIIVSKIK